MRIVNHHLIIEIIVSCLPSHLHMTEFERIKENKLHSYYIQVVPLFFSIVYVILYHHFIGCGCYANPCRFH